MKRKIQLVLLLLAFLVLSACGGNGNVPYDLSGAVRVELRAEETGRAVTVTDEADIKRLAENIQSLTVEKMEYSEPSVLVYTMEWYDAGGERVAKFNVVSGNTWLGFDGYDYSIRKGELDIAFWEELLAEKGAEPESYAFEAQYIRTNGGGEKTAYPYAVVIRSREELEAYYEANKDVFDLERKENVYSDTTIGFLDACDKYDDAYFEDHDVIFAVLEEGSGSIRHEVTDVRRDAEKGGWQITVQSITPEVGTCDMAQWHIMVEIQMGKVVEPGEQVWVVYGGQKQITRAEYSYGGEAVALELPEGWVYEVKEQEGEGSSFGIRFWPEEAEEGKISLYYYPAFGVCGTGLKEEVYTFDSGLECRIGTYDNSGIWSFMVFPQQPNTYVALNEGAGAWWSEYGEEAMEILGSAKLGI